MIKNYPYLTLDNDFVLSNLFCATCFALLEHTRKYFVTVLMHLRITTQDELLNRINGLIPEHKSTNTHRGLQLMRQVFNESGIRVGVKRVGIVITDGNTTKAADMPTAVDEAQGAQDEGIHMYAVGVTSKVDSTFIQNLSSEPRTLKQTYFLIEDYSQLNTIVRGVLNVTCEAQTRMSSII